MAIRFKHQVGAGIIGAYASGVAKSQQRRQKYALDLLQQDRQHQMGMEERLAPAKYRAALGGMGAGGGGAGALGGEWADPMAGALTPQAKVQMNAQRRANARARRMGRAIPHPEAEPQFTPGWKIAEQKKSDAAFIKRDQDIEDRLAGQAFKQDQAREAQAGRERLEGIRREFDVDEDIMAGLRKSELELPEPTQEKLRKLDADRVEALKLGPEERAEFEEQYIQKRRELLRLARPTTAPDVGEEYTKNLRYLDPSTGLPHKEPGEGRVPVTIVDGQPVEIPALAAQRKAKEEQQKKEQEQQAKAEKAWVAQQKEILADAKKRLDEYKRFKNTGDPDKTLTDFMGEVEGDYITAGIPLVPNPDAPVEPPVGGDVFGMAPKAGEAPAQSTGGGVSGTAPPMQTFPNPSGGPPTAGGFIPQKRPLPAGIPAGSKWIDDNRIQLPNGRIIGKTGGGG